MTSEIRKNYLLDKYVIITPSRAKRPRDIKEQTTLTTKGKCPFCKEHIEKLVFIKTYQGKWPVTLLKNKYPAVTLSNPKAFGKQEVVIETEKHGVELSELSLGHIKKILNVYADRTREFTKNKKLDYILIFKNQGSRAGASIFHAHSQIFTTHIVPPDVIEELQLAHEYKITNSQCIWCETIEKEIHGPRKIASNKYAAAFTPYASMYHYEAWIFPKRHIDNIANLNQKELESISKILKLITSKLDGLNLAYNFFMHQVVTDYDQHFYIKIQPRDSIWAGVELGSGMVINSVAPETAAKYYRS